MSEPYAIANARRVIEQWRVEMPHLVQPEPWLGGMVALLGAYDLATQRAEAAEAERDAEVQWLREMLADYRISYDDHTNGRRLALNLFIHELRRERDALLDEGMEASEREGKANWARIHAEAQRNALRNVDEAMVERACRAAHATKVPEHGIEWEYCGTHTQDEWRKAVRAALDAALAVQP